MFVRFLLLERLEATPQGKQKVLALEKEKKHVTFQDNPLKMMDLDGDGIVTNAEIEMFLSNFVAHAAQHDKGSVMPNDMRRHGSLDSLTTDCGNDAAMMLMMPTQRRQP